MKGRLLTRTDFSRLRVLTSIAVLPFTGECAEKQKLEGRQMITN